eukprot:1390023-Amorphochlora_amoeboformis.AAC.2
MRPRSMVAAAGVMMVLPLVCVLGNGLGAGGKRMGWGLAAQRYKNTLWRTSREGRGLGGRGLEGNRYLVPVWLTLTFCGGRSPVGALPGI